MSARHASYDASSAAQVCSTSWTPHGCVTFAKSSFANRAETIILEKGFEKHEDNKKALERKGLSEESMVRRPDKTTVEIEREQTTQALLA